MNDSNNNNTDGFNKQSFAAGILPMTWVDNIPLFLVGKDVRDSTFSDFGGKSERFDRNDALSTACREFYEETCGTIAGQKQVRARLNPSTALIVRGSTQNNYPYWMFITEFPYNPNLRGSFQKLLHFLRSRNLSRTLVEKTDIQWLTLGMLRTAAKRSVFSKTLESNAKVFDELARSKPANFKDICLKYKDMFDALPQPS
jgi:hypothetical protein